MGIGDFIRDRQAEGMSNNDILPLVKAQFAGARTTINSIRWYRTNPKNGPGASRQPPSTIGPRKRGSDSRYHIGNGQNLVIRNILSNIGHESFNKSDWEATKLYFKNKCADCGKKRELVRDHAVPLNKAKLGQHRIGNLVPSCKECNNGKRKGGKDFREYLSGSLSPVSEEESQEKIKTIAGYMESRGYVPLDNEELRTIMERAHKEVSALALRYISMINDLLSDNAINPQM